MNDRHTFPACKCETRQAIPACKVQTGYPSMHSKGHCIKGLQEPRTAELAVTAEIAVGIRRAQYKKTSIAVEEPATTTLKEARKGIRCEA